MNSWRCGRWLVCGDDGEAKWFAVSNGSWVDAGRWQGNPYEVSGGRPFDDPEAIIEGADIVEVGTLTIFAFLGYDATYISTQAFIDGKSTTRGWYRPRY